jgi:hypothetical protein
LLRVDGREDFDREIISSIRLACKNLTRASTSADFSYDFEKLKAESLLIECRKRGK